MLAQLVDLALPRRCLGCGRPGFALCPPCRRPRDLQRMVRGVGVVHAGSRYEQAVRRAVIQYKERDRRDLVADLAYLLRIALLRARRGRQLDALITVPSSRAAVRARGGDHLRRLALRAIGADRDVPVLSPLWLVRRIEDTSGLGSRARRDNVRGAFAATPVSGRPVVLLVDDVITTGASLQEAARALAQAGWVVGGAAVVAATPRRSAPSSQPEHWPRARWGDNVMTT